MQPHPKILLASDPRLAWFDGAAGAGPNASPEAVASAVAGWREWASLPLLGIARVAAKLDTGARTSALHANRIEPFEASGERRVRFEMTGPTEGDGGAAAWHEATVTDERSVRSSNGGTERRVVIATEIEMAGRCWPIELSLTNREHMELPMLIGREALAGRLVVDAQSSWLWGRPVPPASPASPARPQQHRQQHRQQRRQLNR